MDTKLIIRTLLCVLLIILIYRLFFNRVIEKFQNINEVKNNRIKNLLDLVKTNKYIKEPIWTNEIQNTVQKVSFWNPKLQSYTDSLGSTISNGLSSPNTEITLVGGDIKYPTQFEKIVSMGTGSFSSGRNLENELNDINTRIQDSKQRSNQFINSFRTKQVKVGHSTSTLQNPYFSRRTINVSNITVPGGLQVTIYEKGGKRGSSIKLGNPSNDMVYRIGQIQEQIRSNNISFWNVHFEKVDSLPNNSNAELPKIFNIKIMGECLCYDGSKLYSSSCNTSNTSDDNCKWISVGKKIKSVKYGVYLGIRNNKLIVSENRNKYNLEWELDSVIMYKENDGGAIVEEEEKKHDQDYSPYGIYYLVNTSGRKLSRPNAFATQSSTCEDEECRVEIFQYVSELDNDIPFTVGSFKVEIHPENISYQRRSQSYDNNINILKKRRKFIIDIFSGNQDKILGMSIYRPNPPSDYVAIGDLVVGNVDKVPELNSIVCVPKKCTKEYKWNVKHKVWSHPTDPYFDIYQNPYTNTIAVSSAKGKVPSIPLYKIIPCVKSNSRVDKLIKANSQAKKFCKAYPIASETKMLSLEVENKQDKAFQNKIKKQSKMIDRLQQKAQELLRQNSEYEVINRAHNRSRLGLFLEQRKDLIDLAIEKLRRGGQLVDFNIKVPNNDIDRLTEIIRETADRVLTNIPTESLPPAIRTLVRPNVLTEDEYQALEQKILSSCPEINMDGFIKKDPPCYGCFGL